MLAVTTGPQRLTTSYGPLKRVRVKQGTVIKTGAPWAGARERGEALRAVLRVRMRFGTRNPVGGGTPAAADGHSGGHVTACRRASGRGELHVASFNVLGHSHTARGGKKRRQFASSSKRMSRSLTLLDSNRVSLVGLQK